MKKKLRVGIIGGGGPDAFFGNAHRRAINLDGNFDLVAGALRSDPDAAMEAAHEWGIIGYPTWQEMLEAQHHIELDLVTIVTPNCAHYAPALAFLQAGIPVMCEKPMTMSSGQAVSLCQAVDDKEVPVGLAHTYTGHPMMMYAKDMIYQGAIGEIRKVEVCYRQGWLADPLEERGQKQASWRTDPEKAGISGCGGDIGIHAHNTAEWVTGLSVGRVSARLNTFAHGRKLDDDFNVIGEMEEGATAIITATQIARGYKNALEFRVFGTDGSIEWHQERAEKLWINRGRHDEVYWLGATEFPEIIASYTRLSGGHNEDFIPALANLYETLRRRICITRGEEAPEAFSHPDERDGYSGMRFLEAAVASSRDGGAWHSVYQ